MSEIPNCRLTISENPQNPNSNVLLEELSKIIPNSTTENIDCPYNVKIIEQKVKPFSIRISHKNNSVELQIIEYRSLKDLRNKADPYSHLYPELVFNGFNSDISNFLFEFLVGIFPVDIEKLGNRVVSFCAKNDFILFRTYRYLFKNTEKCDFQDVGPHLTLRIRKIIKDGIVTFLDYKKLDYQGQNHIL